MNYVIMHQMTKLVSSARFLSFSSQICLLKHLSSPLKLLLLDSIALAVELTLHGRGNVCDSNMNPIGRQTFGAQSDEQQVCI